VTSDRGIENNFPVTFALRTVTFAAEDLPIFQRKDGLHSVSGEWIFWMIAQGEFRVRVSADRPTVWTPRFSKLEPENSKVLPQPPSFIHRPVGENGLAVDVFLADGAELAAVIGHRAVIAQNPVGPLGNGDGGHGASVEKIPRLVIFVQLEPVHVHASMLDPDHVTGHSDDAFDIALRRIPRVAEDHHVTAFDRLELVDEFIDEDALLVL